MQTSLIYVYIRQNSPCHVRSKCQPNAVKVGGCQSPTFLSQPLPSILACTLCPPLPSTQRPPSTRAVRREQCRRQRSRRAKEGGGRDAAGKGGWAGKTAIERNRLARVRGIKTESELEAQATFSLILPGAILDWIAGERRESTSIWGGGPSLVSIPSVRQLLPHRELALAQIPHRAAPSPHPERRSLSLLRLLVAP
jgi:hypothetical protein